MLSIPIQELKVNYSIILKSDLYLSVSVKPKPGKLSFKSINPFSGVGMGKKPQVFLKAGDTIRLSIENLGEQNSKVTSEQFKY